jgi:hypothetical protein
MKFKRNFTVHSYLEIGARKRRTIMLNDLLRKSVVIKTALHSYRAVPLFIA